MSRFLAVAFLAVSASAALGQAAGRIEYGGKYGTNSFSVTAYDWDVYMDFADRHGWKN